MKATFIVIAIAIALFTTTLAFPKKFGIDHGWPQDDHLYLYKLTTTAAPEFQYFPQNRDHFNPMDLTTFKQRYLINDEFFQPHDPLSPVFIFIGAEGPLSVKWVQQGLAADWARVLGAKLMALEHRGYGETIITPDLSTPNLQYLTTYQAIEDIAFFISSFPELSKRPVILFGGSYGGSLVSWARLFKPNLIAGAVASSGPFLPKIDYHEYLEVAQSALEYYGGARCVDNMQKANNDLYDIYLKNPQQDKLDELTRKLNLCQPLKVGMEALDVQSFWQSLTDSFAGVVQYNKETVTDDVLNLLKVCQMLEKGTNKLDTLIELHNIVNGADQCREWDWDWQVKQLSSLESGSHNAYRSWVFQTCSAYAWFQYKPENDPKTRAFGQPWPVEFFGKLCQAVFGKEWDLERLEKLQNRWIAATSALDWRIGGVIFTHGNIDPWSALMIDKPTNPYAFRYHHFINGTSHCATLYPPLVTDPLPLKEARNKMFQELKEILQHFPFTLQ